MTTTRVEIESIVKPMSVIETVRRRRSIGKMTEQVPTRAQIEEILEAATHAPNHHRTEPWKFIVLAGEARTELGLVMQEALLSSLGDIPLTQVQARLEKERLKPLRAPVIITVVSEFPRNDEALDIENVEATAAAVQNMLLVAEELGLAVMWRTGDAAYNDQVKRWLGVETEDHIVAFLYVGYPAIPRLERRATPLSQKTTWYGWEE
ncbi:nitroreductase family protein [Ktedonobacter racemifer]|uniref:Putative NAD(P)H nitroreductase n=1 Tax=Ktedonobacter racemifer DSM 44963 TaxID=485913 RepID=D6TDM5_KTERA|nr:nitroreductase [Ktedonobacter racemifer]EFH90157.1 nitroreductase [Ktedonobacter racemifer DSM 44963]